MNLFDQTIFLKVLLKRNLSIFYLNIFDKIRIIPVMSKHHYSH